MTGALNSAGGVFQHNTDADGDGLPDAGESEWSSQELLTATGDLDGDGATDADEFAAGTDPTESYDKLDVTTFFEKSGTVSIGWKSVPSRNYRVLTSSDLVSWSYANFLVFPPANPLISPGSPNTPTTTRLVVKPAGTRAFFKVIALKPPAMP